MGRNSCNAKGEDPITVNNKVCLQRGVQAKSAQLVMGTGKALLMLLISPLLHQRVSDQKMDGK